MASWGSSVEKAFLMPASQISLGDGTTKGASPADHSAQEGNNTTGGPLTTLVPNHVGFYRLKPAL